MKKGPLQDFDLKNHMAVDYSQKRGLVGKWKGYQVFVLEQNEYINNQYNLKDDVIYVIADDDMRMVHKGYTIGYLGKDGGIEDCDRVRYRPVPQKPQEKEEEVVISAPGEEKEKEIELTTTIPEGYFDSFAGEVIEFFKNLQDPKVGD